MHLQPVMTFYRYRALLYGSSLPYEIQPLDVTSASDEPQTGACDDPADDINSFKDSATITSLNRKVFGYPLKPENEEATSQLIDDILNSSDRHIHQVWTGDKPLPTAIARKD
jgi:hypothetical protein